MFFFFCLNINILFILFHLIVAKKRKKKKLIDLCRNVNVSLAIWFSVCLFCLKFCGNSWIFFFYAQIIVYFDWIINIIRIFSLYWNYFCVRLAYKNILCVCNNLLIFFFLTFLFIFENSFICFCLFVCVCVLEVALKTKNMFFFSLFV